MGRWAYALICGVVLIVLVGAVVVWRAAASPHYYSTTVSLSVVALPDLDHAWAAGDLWTNGGQTIDGGTIHATTDGGASWREQEFSTDWSDPSGIAFANARCGWLVGSRQPVGDTLPSDENVVLATTDGGVTWQKQPCRTKYLLNAVACASATRAWVVGANVHPHGGVVLVTQRQSPLGEAIRNQGGGPLRHRLR